MQILARVLGAITQTGQPHPFLTGRFWTLAGATLLLLCQPLVCIAQSPTPQPKRNPYLADSPNNQSHWNDAATDSTPAAVPKGHF